jgi:hypothetical protein
MPNLRAVKKIIPWWGKVLGQLLVSSLPITYKFWHRIGLLEHGRMEDPSYGFNVFTQHFGRVRLGRRFTAWVGLELGPGDSLASAVIAKAFGASGYYLIDSGDFAQKDLRIYKSVAAFLEQKGLPAPKLDHITSCEELLKTCNSMYGTGGLASLKAIPTASVDFIWSHVVLQSVRRAEFFETLVELRRILRADGASSHLMDLTDQLGNALNHLRFPESICESAAIAKCGSYSNRYRYSEMLTMFQKAGFNVEVVKVKRWNQLPTARWKLDPQFRKMPDEELLIRGFAVILTPALSNVGQAPVSINT